MKKWLEFLYLLENRLQLWIWILWVYLMYFLCIKTASQSSKGKMASVAPLNPTWNLSYYFLEEVYKKVMFKKQSENKKGFCTNC